MASDRHPVAVSWNTYVNGYTVPVPLPFTYYFIIIHRLSGDGHFLSSTQHHQLQHQQQQQHPFVSARVDQFTPRRQLTTTLQPVRQLPPAGGASSWLAGRKLSAVDEDSLDRLVEINATQLLNRGSGATTRSSSAVRRPTQTTGVVASTSTVYGRSKALPVTNNVAKPFSTGRNY